MSRLDGVGIVVIGRNEGERLKACLRSVAGAEAVVYVDSGSTDGSQDFARSMAVEVVDLAVPPKFTAARARNAGLAALERRFPDIGFVQMVDGDCEMLPGWLEAAAAALSAAPDLAIVFGRLRERHPERSIYNALCDDEWDGPVGDAPGSGGIAMIRVHALHAVTGYDETMIAGEEPDMGMRMRKAGWRIARIGQDMALHDADIRSFAQWWTRARRAGHAFAELGHLHPDARWPDWRRSCRSIVFWGALVPAAIVAALLLAAATGSGWPAIVAMVLIAAYPAQALRIGRAKRRAGLPRRLARASGMLLMIGKLPEALGLASYHRNRLRGRSSSLIEHKAVGR